MPASKPAIISHASCAAHTAKEAIQASKVASHNKTSKHFHGTHMGQASGLMLFCVSNDTLLTTKPGERSTRGADPALACMAPHLKINTVCTYTHAAAGVLCDKVSQQQTPLCQHPP
jgi:hypothetical protein